MHLYVIRHGESLVNLPDWDGLDSDTPLSPLGEKQVEALAAWLPRHLPAVDAIYSSTLRRAKATSLPLGKAYGLDVLFDSRLIEIGGCHIDHSPYPEGQFPARANWTPTWPTTYPFVPTSNADHSETWMHLRIRVATFIEDVLTQRPDQTVIAVCHGGVTDAIFDYCFGIGPWRRCEVQITNTGITHFEQCTMQDRPEIWRLHQHNLTEHLRVLESSTA